MFDYRDAIPSEVQGWTLENGKVSSYKFYLQRVYTILGNQKTELECKGMKVLEHATEILDTHKIKPSLLHGDLWVNICSCFVGQFSGNWNWKWHNTGQCLQGRNCL
jgi:hypothetical protein